MKGRNKRDNKTKYLLILLLLIAVGYAAIATTLKINGSADVKSARWNVYWDENSIEVTSGSVETSEGNGARVTDAGKTQIEYSVELSEPGDYYEFTVDAVNEGSLNAKIAPNGVKNNVYESDGTTPKNLPDYLGYTVKYAENDADVTAGDVLEAKKGNTPTRKKYKVRVWYKTDIDPSTLNESTTETLRLVFEVDYVQGDKTQPVYINPYETTFDGEYTYMHKKSQAFSPEEFDSNWQYYLRRGNGFEVCGVFSGGTVCIEPNQWDENTVCDYDSEQIVADYGDGVYEYKANCNNASDYVLGKELEMESKGATCEYVYSTGTVGYYLICSNNNISCYLGSEDGFVECETPDTGYCLTAGTTRKSSCGNY